MSATVRRLPKRGAYLLLGVAAAVTGGLILSEVAAIAPPLPGVVRGLLFVTSVAVRLLGYLALLGGIVLITFDLFRYLCPHVEEEWQEAARRRLAGHDAASPSGIQRSGGRMSRAEPSITRPIDEVRRDAAGRGKLGKLFRP